MNVLLLDREDVARCLGMTRAIELMQDAFAALSSGRIESPVRTLIDNQHGTLLYKPAASDDHGMFCVKVVSVFPGNAQQDLPVTAGLVLINDAQTGLPRALMDAGYLTSLRTGAATGLATRLLAPSSTQTAALFGTGGQAAHQLEAMLQVCDLQTVFVFSRQLSGAERFVARVAKLAGSCQLIATDDPAVLKDCQLITTATTSATPLFADEDLPQKVHINAIGSLGPQRTEIPPETILRAEVFVDQRKACLPEAGEFRPLLDDGRLPPDFHPTELGERVQSGKATGCEGVSVFKSVGNAAQDIVCAAEILKVAERDGIGRSVTF